MIKGRLLQKHMLNKNLQADEDQHNSTSNLRFFRKKNAKFFANINAGNTDNKGNQTDESDRQQHQDHC